MFYLNLHQANHYLLRCFQLLKPNGRLGLVLPESVFNAVENMQVRLFLYRMFKIKAIVSLPRNVFIDTPTLTSLLFAQKKTAKEIEEWDSEWQKNIDYANNAIKAGKVCISSAKKKNYTSAQEVEKAVLNAISEILHEDEWVIKKGKNSDIIPVRMREDVTTVDDAFLYYYDLLKSASIDKFVFRYAFDKTSQVYDQQFDSFIVDEVGYKLSKRKEKSRPNQLCSFVGNTTKKKIYNLHLCDEPYSVDYNIGKSITVLDIVKKEIKWD